MSSHQTPGSHDVVTGEAVALELRLAQLPSRALGLLMDMTLQVILLAALILLLAAAGATLDDTATAALLLVLVVAVIVGYPLIFETLTRGKTLGKMALGLRAVRDDGGAIRFRHATARALVEVVEIWLLFGVPAFFCSLLNSKGKRFGDLAAGTVVIRERVPSAAGSRAVMPAELAAWAASTDVGRVPDDLALASRQFLVRASGLDPQVRVSMGSRLAAEVARWLAPPPPAGTPVERLLAAVVAERSQREERRITGQAAATNAWLAGPATAPGATNQTPPLPRTAPDASRGPAPPPIGGEFAPPS